MVGETSLLELARRKFPALSKAEEALFQASQDGTNASAASGDTAQDDPANAGSWSSERVVRAECLVWLCTDASAMAFVNYRGLQMEGMRVDGDLNLANTRIPFPLVATQCAFPKAIIVRDAELSTLELPGCHVKGLDATRSKIIGAVNLNNGFKATGEVSFSRSKLHADLQCNSAHLSNPTGKALNADGATINGYAFFKNGFRADGEVRFLGATIGRNLECTGAHLLNPAGIALMADSAKIEGHLFLRQCKSAGEINILGAHITRNVECDGGGFINPTGKSLNANGTKIGGSVFLRGGFTAEGEVCLLLATIGQNLECTNAQLSNPTGFCLNADGAKIAGYCFFRECKSDGEVRLVGATVGRNLECKDSVLANRQAKGVALNADSLDVQGGLLFVGKVEIEGRARLVGGNLGRYFICSGLDGSKTILDLRSARVGAVLDNRESWPETGNLLLDGFKYDRLFEESPIEGRSRIEWLRRQQRKVFLPQPYEELAGVLRKMGHDREARWVMIAKNRERAHFARFFRQDWWWYCVFGWLIGYGYRPRRALWLSVLVISFGTLLFSFGFRNGLIGPNKETAFQKTQSGEYVTTDGQRVLAETYPSFSSIVYSIEAFTPLVRLDQRENWGPNSNRLVRFKVCHSQLSITGSALRYYLVFHVFAGWVLTTLWVGAVTGLVKS